MNDSVHMVNAPELAKTKGIVVSETKTENDAQWPVAIRLKIETEAGSRELTGTLFAGKEPRIVSVENVPIEADLTEHMLFIRNEDKPGMIGGLGMILAEGGQNIADFRLGRTEAGKTAVALVSLDAPLSDELYEKVANLPQINKVKRLRF